jgi:hypothetical protein
MESTEVGKHDKHRWAARIRLFTIRTKNNWLFLLLGLAAGFLIFSGLPLRPSKTLSR